MTLKNVWPVRAVLLTLGALVGGCMSNAAPSDASLTGTATYRERIALPAGAVFEATLEDVSRADAPAEVLGRTRIESPGNPPFRFASAYDTARIDPAHRYVVRARVTVDDRLMFTTGTAYPVLTQGQPGHIDLVMRMPPSAAAAPAAVLEDTHWKLARLGSESVDVEGPRAPHLVLQSDTKRVSGSGGCNRLVGSYALDGNKLGFSQMAGTRMACPEGMEREQAFHAALGKVSAWRINGETLDLFDASGASLAEFERRPMQ